MLPRMTSPRPARRALATAVAMLAGTLGGAVASAEPLDLEGTWYVLIHYRDPRTANPEADRWKDLVWVFARKGSRLEWTEYPIVYFEDASGRFESVGGNPRSRVLNAWEPNADQRRTIEQGPQVNRRGMRAKTLRGSDARGWSSPRGLSGTSATVMSYQENLTIDQLDGLPRFVRADVVGNAITASAGGGTVYAVEQIARDGRLLSGRYTRDEHQTGSFRMWRTPPVRGLPEKDADDGASTRDAPSTRSGVDR